MDDSLEPLRRQFLAGSGSTADAERMTREMADRLSESLAGLPEEVRFMGRRAEALECAAMLESLPLFGQIAARAGLETRYDELVQRCRLHYAAYQRFLEQAGPDDSYAVRQ